MIHSNIKASSRRVPERMLFSSVCFPLRRLGRRWGAFPFVTGRITLLISLTRKVYQFPQITTTQSSASQILAVQDICGVPKRSGKYFTIIPTSDILLSSAQELSATKNHKVIKNDEDDMIVVKNTHESIVSQELWDRVCEMEQSVSQGKRNSSGYVANLSGLITVRTAETKSALRGTIPQTAVRSRENIFATITTALPTWSSESDTVPAITSKRRIWTLLCWRIFAALHSLWWRTKKRLKRSFLHARRSTTKSSIPWTPRSSQKADTACSSLELIEYITFDAYVEVQPREIYIYYKLLDEPLKDKRSLF